MTPPKLIADLRRAASAGPGGPTGGGALDGHRARLARRAQRAGVLDVAFRTLDAPVGTLLLAATEGGVVRITFAVEDHDAVLDDLAARVSPRVLHAPRRLDRAARELDQYFARRRREFDLRLDWQLSSGFRRTVLEHLRTIPYGATESYAQAAAAAGRPRAVRAAGSACATNPLPLVVPCHRILRSDGSLGGFGGGLDNKRLLLAVEAAAGGSLRTAGGRPRPR